MRARFSLVESYMTMNDKFSQTEGAVREGRTARARGLSRDANPYGSLAPQTVVVQELMSANARIALQFQEALWWIGWDVADRELRPSGATSSSTRPGL